MAMFGLVAAIESALGQRAKRIAGGAMLLFILATGVAGILIGR